jgi:hypothetical protein
VAVPEPRIRRPAARLRVRDTAVAAGAVLPGRRGSPHLPRLHSALDYLSPIEFENLPKPWAPAQQPKMLNTNPLSPN